MTAAQTTLQTVNQQLQVLHRVFRHNIRNDLNLIQGYTTLVSDRVNDPTTQDHLETIDHTADQLNTISDKLSVVNQIDPTDTGDTTVDLVEFVTQERDRLQTDYPAVTITTDLPDNAQITGGESLRYAVREAFENATAHFDGLHHDCTITIDIDRTGDTVTLTISDNGPGIPAAEVTAINSEQETPLVHASSVGLWLITWLATVYNGTVEFTADTTGTTVTFDFEPVPRSCNPPP